MQGHADNTALGITNPSQAMYASKTLTGYERASGMLLNRSKSVVLAVHPLNWGRLPPLTLEIDRRRLGFLASRGQQPEGKWLWSSVFPLEVTEGSSAQYTPFDALRTSLCHQREALGITMQTTRWCTRLIIPGDSPIQAEDKKGTLALINNHAMDQPLIFTPTQVK